MKTPLRLHLALCILGTGLLQIPMVVAASSNPHEAHAMLVQGVLADTLEVLVGALRGAK